MRAARAALLCAMVWWLIPTSAGAESEDLTRFLARLDERRATLVDMSATFRQARYAGLFGDTTLSSGVLKFRTPDEMLWEYLTPDHSFLRVGKEDVRFYCPLLAQIEVYPLEANGGMRRLLAGFTGGAAELRKDYDVSYYAAGTAEATLGTEAVTIPDAPGMALVPRTEALKAQFARIDVWVRPDTFVPCLLIIEEPTGDRSTFVFEQITTNTGLDDAALDFHAPPETEIVHVDAAS